MLIPKSLIVFSFLIKTGANNNWDLFKCNDLLLKCQKSEDELGKYSELSNGYNRNCSQEIGSKWNNITRCELEAVICLLNQMNRMDVNCENIADVMHL
ncbi:hypothetical protein KR009_008668 [Drosophila setifemur]|nr:hypothetical protein KR009_008668 [Drosophila setifemur]